MDTPTAPSTADDPAVTPMPAAACWEALAAAPFGRLAVCVAGEVDIFPVNFVVHGDALYFRTAPGSKLAALAAHPTVAVEVDGFDDDAAWSVVVKGEAVRLERQEEIEEAESFGLAPWIPTLKYRWVMVVAGAVTGLVFRRAPEPDRD